MNIDWRKVFSWSSEENVDEIQKLLEAPVQGNFYYDSELLNQIDKTLKKNISLEMKLKLLQKIHDIMGLDTPVNEETLNEYLKSEDEDNLTTESWDTSIMPEIKDYLDDVVEDMEEAEGGVIHGSVEGIVKYLQDVISENFNLAPIYKGNKKKIDEYLYKFVRGKISKIAWQITAASFKELGDEIAKLKDTEWEVQFLDNINLTEFGIGIQAEVLYATGKEITEQDIHNALEGFVADEGKIQISGAEEIIIIDGLWVGLEGGVDRAILGMELNNGLCLLFEGAPARPSTMYYKGKNKKVAVITMGKLLEKLNDNFEVD